MTSPIIARKPSRLAAVRRIPSWGWQIGVAAIIYASVSYFILADYPNLKIRFRPSLARLLAAEPIIQVHVTAAIATFCIGLVLMLAPKGFRLHRMLGWSWVVTMSITAISSFFITGIMGSTYSPIHALSAYTMLGLPFGIAAVRRRNITKHRKDMTGMFVGAMVIAGLFSFLPGRLMWSLVFASHGQL